MSRIPAVLAASLAVALAAGCSAKPKPPNKPVPLSTAAYSAYLYGRIAAHEGDYQRAAHYFSRAAAAAPDQADIVVAHADALHRSGAKLKALAVIERAQAEFPRSGAVWLESGRLYRKSRRYRDADAALTRSIELSPDTEDAYLLAARTALALEQPQREIAILRRLVARDAQSFRGNYRLGDRLLSDRKFASAEQPLRQAVADRPTHVRARVLLARVLLATRRKTEAVELLQVAFDRTSRKIELAQRLTIELALAGHQADAIAVIRKLDRDDLDARTRTALASIALQLGAWNVATSVASAVAKRSDPAARGRALVVVARSRWSAGSRQQAAAVLAQVKEGDEQFELARSLEVEYRAELGDVAAAKAAMSRIPADTTAAVIAHSRILEASDVIAARSLFESTSDKLRADPALLIAWATFEMRAGSPKLAIKPVEALVALDPDHPVVLNLAGFVLTEASVERSRALQYLERAAAIGRYQPEILDSYGWALLRAGQKAKAKTYLERAVALSPHSAEILFHVAELELQTIGRPRAIATLRRALSLARYRWLKQRISARLAQLAARS